MTTRPLVLDEMAMLALVQGRKRRLHLPALGADIAARPEALHEAVAGDYQRGFAAWLDAAGRFNRDALPVAAGDRLWARETLSVQHAFNRRDATARYRIDGTDVLAPSETAGNVAKDGDGRALWRWKRDQLAAQSMPRWASRYTLVITDLEIFALADIPEAAILEDDVFEETIATGDGDTRVWTGPSYLGNATPRQAFENLWDARHNPLGCCAEDAPNGSAANPWVVSARIEVLDTRARPFAAQTEIAET